MTQKNSIPSKSSLKEVKEQFKLWRRTRKNPHPIPAELLKAAAGLTADYSVRQISEELIIDYDDLKQACTKTKKVKKKSPPANFIELDFGHPIAVSECTIEMQDVLGAKMRLHLSGQTDFDLLELVNAFWRKES
jgi:hypothetical protein